MKIAPAEAAQALHVPAGVMRLAGAAKEIMNMYRIQTMNKISPVGLNRFPSELYEVSDTVQDPQGILVRSAKLLDMEFNPGLLAIARAGVGVNNIPIERCSEAGIAVFSTPGANANAVKELVVCAMLMSSRDIPGAIRWVREQAASGVEVSTVVEKGKSAFVGPELYKKTIGIIGLGAIGAEVANAAAALGMEVYGYDPFISVKAAWMLSRDVKHITSVDTIYQECDYITVHVPLLDSTRQMINKDSLGQMKDGVVILNFARDLLVNDDDMAEALASGRVKRYITDFPNAKVMQMPNVIATPHLGASTEESEDNCAVMAVKELMDYLDNGNIKNSVNFPNCDMGVCTTVGRLALLHKNVPNMIGQISSILASTDMNIANMTNKSRDKYAYTLVDLETKADAATIEKLKAIQAERMEVSGQGGMRVIEKPWIAISQEALSQKGEYQMLLNEKYWL